MLTLLDYDTVWSVKGVYLSYKSQNKVIRSGEFADGRIVER